MVSITDSNFEKEVMNSPLPVLVDFWAPWCAPCRMLAPVIEELAREFEGQAKIGKCNVDENPATAANFSIRSIPTIKIFKDGNEVETIVGLAAKDQIAERIKRYL